MGFIYLIIPEKYKHLKGQQCVYKVGMTEHVNLFDYLRSQKKRYGENPIILETFEFDTNLAIQVESKILTTFKEDERMLLFRETVKSREYFNVVGVGSRSYIREQTRIICGSFKFDNKYSYIEHKELDNTDDVRDSKSCVLL